MRLTMKTEYCDSLRFVGIWHIFNLNDLVVGITFYIVTVLYRILLFLCLNAFCESIRFTTNNHTKK